MKSKVFVHMVNHLVQASVIQWKNNRLPRDKPGFDSRMMQISKTFLERRKIKFCNLFCSTVKKEENYSNKWLNFKTQLKQIILDFDLKVW